MGRVIVIGSVNVDLVVRGTRLPRPGETIAGGTFQRFHGGKGGNQAVAAARLGGEVALVGAVGDDAFGSDAVAALRLEGVVVDELVRVADAATGVALILIGEGGENLISVASGANARLLPEQVGAALERLDVHRGDVVLTSHEVPAEAVHAGLVEAARRGTATILNPAPAGGIRPEALAPASILTPNAGELRMLAGRSRSEASHSEASDGDEIVADAQRVLGPSPVDRDRAVLVSLGARGAALILAGAGRGPGRPDVLRAPVVDAVDTTGAGDALNGALATGLAAGLPLDAAARRAVLAASLSVTRLGAREGMPTTAELETFIAATS